MILRPVRMTFIMPRAVPAPDNAGMQPGRTEPESTIDELITARPFLVDLLAKLEFFCHPDRTLLQACDESGISVDEVLALIDEACARREEERP